MSRGMIFLDCGMRNVDCGLKRKVFELETRNSQPGTGLVTFQPGERLVEFFQVGLLAGAGEMEEEGVLQLRAEKPDPEGFAGFFLEQAFADLSKAVFRRMPSRDSGTLRRDRHALEVQFLMLAEFDLDHEVYGDLPGWIEDDLIGLTGFHPGNVPSLPG